MAFHYSPKIVTDGLAFYYDTNNEKKSYLGKPTTNFITNGDFTGKANAGTGGTGGDNPLNEIVEASNPGDSPFCLRSTAVGGNIYTEYQMDLTTELVANTTYVMSCWYSFSPDWNGSTAVFHSRAFSTSGANVATGADAGTAIETRVINGTTWTRAYQTITTPADYSNYFNWYLGYPSSNTAGYRYFTNIQVEQGTYPTPFTRTPRTTTNAIKDLTGKNTITINSLTYANDRTTSFTFDGSTNYFSGGALAGSFSQFTVSVWFYSTSVSNYRNPIDCNFNYNATTGNIGPRLEQNSSGNLVWTVSGNTTNNAVADSFTVQSSGLLANTWYNAVITWTSGSASTYLNGVPVTINASTPSGFVNVFNNVVIGKGFHLDAASTRSFVGKVPTVMIYNRSLTAAEVVQNFNAQRGRYGV